MIKSSVDINAQIQITLTEGEARALDAIVGYGPGKFVEWFYANLGRHYLKPHEKDMINLFDKVRNNIGTHLFRVDKARQAVGQASQEWYKKNTSST